MLQKADGGFRELLMNLVFVHVCLKARREFADLWAMRNDRPALAAGTDRDTVDVAWRTAVRPEAKGAQKLTVAEI